MPSPQKPRSSKSQPSAPRPGSFSRSAAPRFPFANPPSPRLDESPSRPARPKTDDAQWARPKGAKPKADKPQGTKPTAAGFASARPKATLSQAHRSQSGAPRQAKPQAPRVPAPATPIHLDIPAPYVAVARRASENLRRGHLWVYASDVVALQSGPGDAPRIIPVVDTRGIPLGTALFSPTSQIQLRIVSREILTAAAWMELFEERLHTSIARRKPLLDADTNACRLVFSEADQLPGLVIDKYAAILVVQLLCRGLDTPEIREACVRVLKAEFSSARTPITIWERQDPRIRELEGLTPPSQEPMFATKPRSPLVTTLFRANGLDLHFDVNAGQKTGAFLDQRQNYLAAAGWAVRKGATGKALDVCTYQGGFALHLARVCKSVTGVDASNASLQVAEQNLAQNRTQLSAEVDWVEADAFQLLRDWSDAATTPDWDIIVLDPPAFAKSKRAAEGALRGYKELNLRALKMIRPGGLLVTCSCSHHVSLVDLETSVAAAAADCGRRVTLLERRSASEDHPVVFNQAESEYLKCLILQVD